jgi:FKBP-type peptidyl-prolyl cis-trans isomerase
MFKRVFYLFIIVTAFGCSSNQQEQVVDPFKGMSTDTRKKELEGALKRSAKKEHQQIDSFLKRHNISAEKTGSGVRYAIYKKGEGRAIKTGDVIEASYLITNIRGDTIYEVPDSIPVKFQVEKSEKESGLHEAIKYLSVTSKAIIVIPSYRAHGISGDDNKIPPLTTVIYNIKIHGVL